MLWVGEKSHWMFLKSTVYTALSQRAEPTHVIRMNCVTIPAVYYKGISSPEEKKIQAAAKRRTKGSASERWQQWIGSKQHGEVLKNRVVAG